MNIRTTNRFSAETVTVTTWIAPTRAIRILAAMVFAAVFVMPQSGRCAAGRIVTGTETIPHVKAYTPRTHSEVASFFAYTPSFSGGVRVAAGDVNGDGAADIVTGTGPGAAHVKVFSGRTLSELQSFLPFAGFSGGVFVAAGDVNGDGYDDLVVGADSGAAPQVKVFNGRTMAELHSFFAYGVGFTGGVRVATGDINGDGRADIITGSGPGGVAHVKVFHGSTLAELRSFFAYGANFSGGVYVSGGDIDGDGIADIITGAGPGAGPHLKVFDGKTGSEVRSFFAYSAGFNGGVRVASGDLNGDGRSEILTSPGVGMAAAVRAFDPGSLAEVANILPYSATYTNGVYVSAASVKPSRLETALDRSKQEIQLQWPAGCVCELEVNENIGDSRQWTVLEVRPVESGNRVGLLLPAVQKFEFYRLICDDELVR